MGLRAWTQALSSSIYVLTGTKILKIKHKPVLREPKPTWDSNFSQSKKAIWILDKRNYVWPPLCTEVFTQAWNPKLTKLALATDPVADHFTTEVELVSRIGILEHLETNLRTLFYKTFLKVAKMASAFACHWPSWQLRLEWLVPFCYNSFKFEATKTVAFLYRNSMILMSYETGSLSVDSYWVQLTEGLKLPNAPDWGSVSVLGTRHELFRARSHVTKKIFARMWVKAQNVLFSNKRSSEVFQRMKEVKQAKPQVKLCYNACTGRGYKWLQISTATSTTVLISRSV